MFPCNNAKPREAATYSVPALHKPFNCLCANQRGHGSWRPHVSSQVKFLYESGSMPRELQKIQEQGWSLIELLIVLAILGIISVLAGPSYQTLTARGQARSAIAEIASELRLARQLAMARRERLRIIFDRESRTITLRRADAEGILHVYQYADKRVVVEEPTAGPELLFHPSGRSATPTTIRVRDSQGRETTFTVSITGKVSAS